MSSMCSNPFVSLFLARSLSLSAPVSTFAAHPFSAPSPRVSYLSVLFFYWLLVTPVWCNKITFSSLPPSLPLSFPIQANLFILPSPSSFCPYLLYLFLFVSSFCHSLETYELIFLVSPSCISCPSLLSSFFSSFQSNVAHINPFLPYFSCLYFFPFFLRSLHSNLM